jgi:hypothetical protein
LRTTAVEDDNGPGDDDPDRADPAPVGNALPD